ncbi:MAG TPA: hypothetical protein PLL66_04520, partial [Bacteroidales bacterium]|nr:hypothetical protein [Bacteroidales bacterium]
MRSLKYVILLLLICASAYAVAQEKSYNKKYNSHSHKIFNHNIPYLNHKNTNSTLQLTNCIISEKQGSNNDFFVENVFERRNDGVEMVEKRDRYSKTFANPDGSFSKMQSSAPMHYKDKNGNWLTYNANLVKEKNKDGIFVLKGTD